MSWLRKILQKEYNVTPRTNNHQNQPPNNNTNKGNGTEDWLQMLINELAKISGDASLTPIKILTGWGTQKMRKFGLQLKNKFWKSIFTGIEKLEEGFYHKNTAHLGEMVIWGTQQVRTRGIQLTARGAASIGYGETRDTLGITTVYHIRKAVPKPKKESTKKANESKSRHNLEQETGKKNR